LTDPGLISRDGVLFAPSPASVKACAVWPKLIVTDAACAVKDVSSNPPKAQQVIRERASASASRSS
jgi:hypothetical protein